MPLAQAVNEARGFGVASLLAGVNAGSDSKP